MISATWSPNRRTVSSASRDGSSTPGADLANAVSLREMTGLCKEIAGRQIDIEAVVEDRPADIRIYITDHRRLTDFCGWRPHRDVCTTLADIRRWIRDEAAAVTACSGRGVRSREAYCAPRRSSMVFTVAKMM